MRRAVSAVLLVSFLANTLMLASVTQSIRADGIAVQGGNVYTGEAVRSTSLLGSLLERDLNDIADDAPEIEGFYLEEYTFFTVVHISYTSGLTDYEKIGLQFIVQDELELKWYIRYVDLSWYITIPENPPPPWPGFAIGKLIAGFIDSPFIRNINTSLGYETIQEAINANETLNGHTIYVSSGTYYEHVVVNKTLSLVGENREGAIIDGNGTGTSVTVLANDTRVTGFTMQNGLDEVMMVENVSGVEVSQNNIFESGLGFYGIHIWFSVEVALVDNIIIDNHPVHIGIGIYGSNSCLISRNEISNGWPVLLVGSNSSTISDNLLFSKGPYGTRLTWSYNNLICGNTILNASFRGLALDYASEYNRIFHNNFLNNTVQVGSPHYFTLNYWDNGCEGNYWLDYNGTDADGDGIGDTPHVINENNTDPYPLIAPYWNPGDIDHNMEVDIFDVVLCAIAYGSTPLDVNWNPHCDIAEPYGIINIFDIVTIAASYGEEYTP